MFDIQPVFIGGCGRSGTTMLASFLGVGEKTIATPESDFIYRFYQVKLKKNICNKYDLANFLENDWRYKQWGIKVPDEVVELKVDTFKKMRRSLLFIVTEYSNRMGLNNIDIWIDHTPMNIRMSALILNIFPKAKFIHMVRDPRGVYASVKDLDWGPNSAYAASKWWINNIAYGSLLERAYPERVKTIKYEDFLMGPEKILKDVCKFIGKDYSRDMLSGSGFNKPKYTKSQHKLVGNEVKRTRANAWKNKLSNYEKKIIESYTHTLLELYGYDTHLKIGAGIALHDKMYSFWKEILWKIPNLIRKKLRQ